MGKHGGRSGYGGNGGPVFIAVALILIVLAIWGLMKAGVL